MPTIGETVWLHPVTAIPGIVHGERATVIGVSKKWQSVFVQSDEGSFSGWLSDREIVRRDDNPALTAAEE